MELEIILHVTKIILILALITEQFSNTNIPIFSTFFFKIIIKTIYVVIINNNKIIQK
jgi:hypothetical protein